MRVLLYDETPAYLCHGGKQVLVEALYKSLRALGVDADYARWWEPRQSCDVLHTFCYSPPMLEMAREAGAKVVCTHLVDVMTNCSPAKRAYHRLRNSLLLRLHLNGISRILPWYILRDYDALIYLTQPDAETGIRVYGAPREKVNVVPHGCDIRQLVRLEHGARHRQSYLVTVGSIVPRKNSVLLAKAATVAHVPVVFLGKPFNEDETYYREFLGLVDDVNVIYRGFVTDDEKTRWLTGASGFVLLSQAESGCIAVYEAAAAGLPLLLSDLPWGHAYGHQSAIENVGLRNEIVIAARLRSFFAEGMRLEGSTFPVTSWEQVADEHVSIYKRVLGL
jgi:glycosyltransferase involved in cell wall biosynthesis